jgi:molybdate transport repressor ModE-like protein
MSASNVLTPDALHLIERIARAGSLAAAARELGLVPSALTYRVRQIEEALDVLLFDRSGRQVTLTDAGQELLREGRRILAQLDAVANRVKRVATGWEPQLTLSIDSLISQRTVHELCEAFFERSPPTQLKLRSETLTGTWEALAYGEADLALGVVVDPSNSANIQSKPLGDVPFVFAIAPHHPLANAPEPLPDALIEQHRAVAVADTARRSPGMSTGLLSGQQVLTVADMQAKLQAQLRGLGCGYLPDCLAGEYIKAGHLVGKRTERFARTARVSYAWRRSERGAQGQALSWWLKQLENPRVRQALLYAHQPIGQV